MKTSNRLFFFTQRKIDLFFTYLALAFLLAFLLLPVLWMIIMSLKGSNLYADPYSFFIKQPNLEPYQYWLTDSSSNFWPALRNTFMSFLVVALVTVPLGSMAGYSLARWKSKWVDIILMVLFFLQLMPIFVMVGPLFRILVTLKLYTSLPGLYIIYVSFNLPLIIYTMRNYMLTISTEIEEAAVVDGCTRWQSFWLIALPLSQPALLTSILFVFVNVWLEYLMVNVLMRGKFPTISILLITYSNTAQNWRPDLMLSLSVLIMIPLVILFPVIRKYMVTGLTAGAVK